MCGGGSNYVDLIIVFNFNWERCILHSTEKWKKKKLSHVQLDFILFWIYGEVPLKRLVRTFQIIFREKCFSVGKPSIKQSKQKPPSQEVIEYNPKITVESRSE